MKQYSPEIGQAMFGQPFKQYELPDYIEALLQQISNELSRVMWNVHQKEWEDPFTNSGNSYKNDTFEVEAYSWNDEVEQPYNFKWKDVEISWYKHLGRGATINQKIGHNKAIKMFDECLKSLRKIDEKHLINSL